MSSMELREIEKTKIKCAQKFFEGLNKKIGGDGVRYDVVDNYGTLMELVGR
jgi:type III restriction enzyme